MARPIKQGLDYYPLDVGFLRDTKTRRIMRACGLQSIPIIISLLGNIYRDEGYFMQWNADMPFLIADEVGVSEGAVIEAVEKAAQVDFFDARLLKEQSALTSVGIQRRFFDAVARRKEVRVRREILLISVNDYNNLIFVDNNSINDDSNEQSKVKESKGKKRKADTQERASDITELSDTVLNACRKLCGGLGPSQYEDLSELVEMHGEQRVLEALRTAGRRGHRRLAYAAGILKNWRKDGYDGDSGGRGGSAGTDQEKRNTGAGDIERYRNITGL